MPDCTFDFDCRCGSHCAFNPADGGNQCVPFADSPGGPTGGFCYCENNIAGSCLSASCGCPGDTCACDHQNCNDGGAGTCHPRDAGRDCTVDSDCPGGCRVQVCSHAMEYYLCVPAFGTDPGFCNDNRDCPCPNQLCDTSLNSCVEIVVDAGADAGPANPQDSGVDCLVDIDCAGGCGSVCSHAMAFWLCIQGSGDRGQGFCNTDLDCPCVGDVCDYESDHLCRSPAHDAGADAGGDAGGGGTTFTSRGGGTSCSSGGGLAGIGVLGLISAAVLSRRRRRAGRPWGFRTAC